METMRQVGDAYVACSAVVLGDVRLGPGASLWHNVVARGDDAAILVGANANVQDLTGRFLCRVFAINRVPND